MTGIVARVGKPLLLNTLLLALPFVGCKESKQNAPGNEAAARRLLDRSECPTIGIIPLGPVTSGDIADVEQNIKEFFHAEVILLDADRLPRFAFYKPRNRYRADSLLAYLVGKKLAADKIIALTTSDISVTKGEHRDWGVVGLGELGGQTCIVSTWRIRESRNRDLRRERLLRSVRHELGHTFGLEHCPDSTCNMTDAKGTPWKRGNDDGTFCSACMTKLREAGAICASP
jgi:archaemetzincin